MVIVIPLNSFLQAVARELMIHNLPPVHDIGRSNKVVAQISEYLTQERHNFKKQVRESNQVFTFSSSHQLQIAYENSDHIVTLANHLIGETKAPHMIPFMCHVALLVSNHTLFSQRPV
jgi:hypothetical protein